MRALIIIFLLALCGCSRGGDDYSPAVIARSDCPHPLVVLPDNYIIELAADAAVELNPAARQFALFCSVKEAREALAADLAAKRVEGEGRWRVYSLDGTYEELAKPCGSGQACLGRPARLLEWVDAEP